MTLEILSTGVAGNYNGALQVVLNKIKHSLISYLILQISTFISYFSPLQMTAEFQVPSPLVPTRENYFVRYCKQHVDGTWAVVDVSLDSLRGSPISKSRRRPSGCVIQELPNGYSKVVISTFLHSLVGSIYFFMNRPVCLYLNILVHGLIKSRQVFPRNIYYSRFDN